MLFLIPAKPKNKSNIPKKETPSISWRWAENLFTGYRQSFLKHEILTKDEWIPSKLFIYMLPNCNDSVCSLQTTM